MFLSDIFVITRDRMFEIPSPLYIEESVYHIIFQFYFIKFCLMWYTVANNSNLLKLLYTGCI